MSISSYTDKSYIYAVSRIRYAELRLLDGSVFDRLTEAKDVDECIAILAEKGFGGESREPESMLACEKSRLWELIAELVPDMSVFDVFRIQNDFSNLKAAIKESAFDQDIPGIYSQEAVTDPEIIKQAVRERRYKDLPLGMAEIAETCHELFLRTGDGQLCDIMIDRAAMEALTKAAEETREPVLMDYARLTVGAMDIKIAVRAMLTGKGEDFLLRALAACDALDIGLLIRASISGMEALYSYLSNTEFKDAVPELRRSLAAFEKYCDDLIIMSLGPQKWNSFGLGPIAAYILARETEIRSVRILLTAKQNGFSAESIKERMRRCYV